MTSPSAKAARDLPDEIERPKDDLAFAMICAFNGYDPEKAPLPTRFHPNQWTMDAWTRVADAARAHLRPQPAGVSEGDVARALVEVLGLFDEEGALFCSGDHQLRVIARARAALLRAPAQGEVAPFGRVVERSDGSLELRVPFSAPPHPGNATPDPGNEARSLPGSEVE